ncbi:MAG TPA: hypothetical protein VMZ69_10850 [Saprospiraceae bacterium]|nr:hypothetical protein [Saprospiraceae bacterium]
MKSKLLSVLFISLVSSALYAQETVHDNWPSGYDPHHEKLIPDKVFEIGLPLLFLFLLANAIVTIFKIRAESRLKEKVLDKQLSDSTLGVLFTTDKSLAKYSYLKWFFILASLGISFMIIPFIPDHSYFSVGLVSLLLSLAFLCYFLILKKNT